MEKSELLTSMHLSLPATLISLVFCIQFVTKLGGTWE